MSSCYCINSVGAAKGTIVCANVTHPEHPLQVAQLVVAEIAGSTHGSGGPPVSVTPLLVSVGTLDVGVAPEDVEESPGLGGAGTRASTVLVLRLEYAVV